MFDVSNGRWRGLVRPVYAAHVPSYTQSERAQKQTANCRLYPTFLGDSTHIHLWNISDLTTFYRLHALLFDYELQSMLPDVLHLLYNDRLIPKH